MLKLLKRDSTDALVRETWTPKEAALYIHVRHERNETKSVNQKVTISEDIGQNYRTTSFREAAEFPLSSEGTEPAGGCVAFPDLFSYHPYAY